MKLKPFARLALCSLPLAASGCATSDFAVPPWPAAFRTDSPPEVAAQLRAHVAVFDDLIKKAEGAKGNLDALVITSALATPAFLAWGAGVESVTALAAAGGAGVAGGNYVQPRQRLTSIIQARGAMVCVSREFENQATIANAHGLTVPQDLPETVFVFGSDGKLLREKGGEPKTEVRSKRFLSLIASEKLASMNAISGQVTGAGRMALLAADDIVTKLKLSLAGIGSAPDFAAIVRDVEGKLNKAEADAETAGEQFVSAEKTRNKNFTADEPDPALQAAIKELSEYPVRLTQCVAKMP